MSMVTSKLMGVVNESGHGHKIFAPHNIKSWICPWQVISYNRWYVTHVYTCAQDKI